MLFGKSHAPNRSPLKHHIKKQQRCEWLNAPNNYKKEELDETGTTSPKKYIRVGVIASGIRYGFDGIISYVFLAQRNLSSL